MTTDVPTLPDAGTPSADALRESVRAKYAAVARGEALSCCGPSDCGPSDATDAVVTH